MSHVKAALLTLLTVLIAAALYYTFSESDGASQQGSDAVTSDRPSAGHMPDGLSGLSVSIDPIATKPVDQLPPLPPTDAPLSDQLPLLIERAHAGDTVAACRLIIATTRCKELVRHRNLTQRAMRALERSEGKRDRLLVDLIASTAEQGADGQCEGVEASTLPAQQEVFDRAAASMTPRQKTVLALMRSDGTIRRLNRSSEYFTESALYAVPQFLADNTHSFLLEGYQARDPLALEGLLMLHAPGTALSPTGAGVWLPNPKKYLQYALVFRELFGAQALTAEAEMLIVSASAALTPAQIEDVMRFVDNEVSSWRFDGVAKVGRVGVSTDAYRIQPNDCAK